MCCHLIVGLSGENQRDHLLTLQRVVASGVDGIKLHPLHVVTGSTGPRVASRAFARPALEDYAVSAGEMIRHTPGEVVYHRLSASARRPTLLAPLWCENRWSGMQAVGAYLQQYGGQGSALDAALRYSPTL